MAEEQRLKRTRPKQQPSHTDNASSPTVLYTADQTQCSSGSRGGRSSCGGRNARGSHPSGNNLATPSQNQIPHYPWTVSPLWPPYTWANPAYWATYRPARPTHFNQYRKPAPQQPHDGLLGPSPSTPTTPQAAFHTTNSPGLATPQQLLPPMTQDQPTGY